MTKFVFVTGGVVSGIGKGITAASLGRLLKERGFKITAQKLDPYINVDPGTMSPYEHGEVFVTEDGAETDLDLGHYERFINENLNKYSNLTTGKVYSSVLSKERSGDYLGKTIQVIPHITNEIKRFIYLIGEKTNANIVIIEIGGTVGDIESGPFLEAARQVFLEKGSKNCIFIHVTLIPFLKCSCELKSKPTQHSVKELRSLGIDPNIIVARCDEKLTKEIRQKIALFCNVKSECVIENKNVSTIYNIPLMLEKEGFCNTVLKELSLEVKKANMNEWKKMIDLINKRNKKIKIALIGKYVKLHDAYLSIVESLNHAGYKIGAKIDIKWIDSELITEYTVSEMLSDCDGILVPGGFGYRGVLGKITAIKYARENNIPFFGICLGMQAMALEFARNVLNIKNANSSEFAKDCNNNVIDLMKTQQDKFQKGGTMRLGTFLCKVKENSILMKSYKESFIKERHRHRYEFNNNYRERFLEAGMLFSGTSPNGILIEAMELPTNDFFVGVQFHPEFKSRPNHAHPLFYEFVKSSLKNKEKCIDLTSCEANLFE